MKNKIIYVAHPFGGKKSNVKKVEKIILELIKEYPDYIFFSPLHATGFYYYEKSYDEGINGCLKLLSRCDEAWFCKGWDKSKGCNMEFEYCLKNKVPFREV